MLQRQSCLEGIVLLVVTIVGAGLAGCAQREPLGQVEGRVTFKQQPVAEGTVSFSSEKGAGGEARLDADGRYAVKTLERGLPLGEYIVTITPAVYLDKSDPHTPPVMEEKKAPNIPEKYRRTGSTPLRFSVKEGKNEANFDMKP